MKSNVIQLLPQLDPAELNNTRKARNEILFFNRVPKVGSQTTMELMKSLSARNQFQYHKDGVQKVEKIKMSFSEEVSLGTLSLNYDFHPRLMDNTVETPIIMDSFQC